MAMRRTGARRVFLGGHSYGGRQASMLAASDPTLVDGLLLLSYPLHPPQKPAELRTKHFPSLQTPALFVHGVRDGFGAIAEMQSALALIPAQYHRAASSCRCRQSRTTHEKQSSNPNQRDHVKILVRVRSNRRPPNLMTPRKKSTSDPATTVDLQLAKYRAMRDFNVTEEPRGGKAARPAKSAESLPVRCAEARRAAIALRFPARLACSVLKSWAVSKGPSYFPGDKRLAVEVEDHPMEYGGFEGTIPKGQYGGGTVMVWDFGEWQPLGDVDQQLEKGDLKFLLNGTKLKGKWVLVRMKRNPARDRSDKPNWLLIKERDEYTQPEDAPAVTEVAPDSALTHRTMEQIAESGDHVWDSGQGLRAPQDETPKTPSQAPRKRTPAKKNSAIDKLLRSAPEEKFPGFIAPQLAEEARTAPTGKTWLHELKLDGYRIQIHVQSTNQSKTSKARLFTRKGLDWTARMPSLARAAAELEVESAILDGEIVVLDESGRTSFPVLQTAFQDGKDAGILYFAFDLLHLNGHNLRGLPLNNRKEILENLLSRAEISIPMIRFCEHIHADGNIVFAKASALGAEGIVSKLIAAPYTSGRGKAWLKIKAKLKQELVIGGFSPVAKTGRGVGALLLGYYDDDELIYAGRCGTGFTDKVERMLRIPLRYAGSKNTELCEAPRARQGSSQPGSSPNWLRKSRSQAGPGDDVIRQASFKGLRDDKPAKEVVQESSFIEESDASKRSPRFTQSQSAASDSKPNSALGITNPKKILDEESGMTKLQLAEYYVVVAERMLPHVSDRPLSVLRCPDGIGKQAFFQKRRGCGIAEWRPHPSRFQTRKPASAKNS